MPKPHAFELFSDWGAYTIRRITTKRGLACLQTRATGLYPPFPARAPGAPYSSPTRSSLCLASGAGRFELPPELETRRSASQDRVREQFLGHFEEGQRLPVNLGEILQLNKINPPFA